MGHGAKTVYTQTLTSGGTLTSAIDLGRAWNSVYLEITSIPSNSQIHIQAAETLAGTYRRVYHPSINSSTVTTNVFAVSSAVTNAIVPIPGGLRFMKVETTMAIDNGTVFKIHGGDF